MKHLSGRIIETLVWGALLLTLCALLAVFLLFPARAKPLPVYGTVPAFALQDQESRKITLDDLRGQVWIADAIFTRCPGQCLIMSGHMKEIQAALPQALHVKLVSFTTDPAFDTPPVLKKYAGAFGAEDGRWIFLTGDAAALHHTLVDGLKLSVLDKPPGQRDSADDLFIHSEKLVLLDQSGRIRGYFDGETLEAVSQAVAAAKMLARQ
ncbi:MAG: SCO family protein [Verrucomicrobiota bacterium]|jgi:protein SCO1/2